TDLHASIPPVLSVRHPDIQNALIAAASDAGAHVFRPATVTLDRTAAGPTMEILQGDTRTLLTPRLVVGADGSRSATRSWIGGSATRDPIHHYLAGTLIDGIELPANAAHHASGPGGFSMIFPQTDRQYRLYFVCLPDERAALQGANQAEAVVGGASRFFPDGSLDNWTAHGPTGFFPNADVVSSVVAGPNCVLIGDAAGANDPSLGHGMALTFKDVRELSSLLLGESDWDAALEEFASRRAAYFDVLRQHAIWTSGITTEIGVDADAARARVARARQLDPAAGGFAALFAMGPDGLVADEAARQHFLGLDFAS
ncbi:MAG: FAD-dependent monooxygenase, partial [Thermomicrobiales bacterium]